MSASPSVETRGTLRAMLERRERLSVPEAMEIALRVAEDAASREQAGETIGSVTPASVVFDANEVPRLAPASDGGGVSSADVVRGLGATAYEMLAGINPQGEGGDVADVREYLPALQPEIADLVMSMLSADPGQRPVSVAAAADQLRRLKRTWWKEHAEPAAELPDESGELLQPGQRFRGYVVERPLGRGGLGAVYLARHETLDVYFALKVLFPSVAVRNPEYVRRFTREARLASRIRHPNVVAVHDAGFDEASQLHFMVMDYVTGSSLRLKFAFEGQLAVAEAVRIVRCVAEALAAGERLGLVHRDLKPENVMETQEGAVKLIDFGVAKTTGIVTDSLCTMDNAIFGTPNYVSPEQAVDSRDVDARSDIYSLGVILYEALAGRRPVVGATPGEMIANLLSNAPAPDVRTFRPDVPGPLAELLARMLAKRREDRPSQPSEIVAELARLGFGGAGLAAPAEEQPVVPGGAESSMADLLKLAGAEASAGVEPPPRRSWIRRILGLG